MLPSRCRIMQRRRLRRCFCSSGRIVGGLCSFMVSTMCAAICRSSYQPNIAPGIWREIASAVETG